jgi:V/A-type H+/Na+-transporting ATPase subunit K
MVDAVTATQAVVMSVEAVEASQLGMKALAAAIAIVGTGLASAWAELSIGSAAVGAVAENKDLFGSVLVLTIIPETIVIFGLVVGLLLIL